MASIVKRRLKGKTLAFYGRVKRGGQWTQAATNQPTKVLAYEWATLRCECPPCVRKRNHGPALPIDPDPVSKPAPALKTVGDLMDEWSVTLRNRNAPTDRSRIALHVRPHFADMMIEAITLAVVMGWIDKLRATVVAAEKRRGRRIASPDGKMSDATVLGCFGMLSRFFSWAIERGHAQYNPCRLVPPGRRPKASPKRSDAPWLKDDKTVRDVMGALAPPYRQMFYLGNRSGLRPCEQRGLRMSDFSYVRDERPAIRARYSDDHPFLKEDKGKTGEPKWAPVPDDFDVVMGPWLAKRQAEGAGPEDYVFAPELTRCALEQRMLKAFNEAVDALGLDIGQYQATRHSMISRNLDAGVPVDEGLRLGWPCEPGHHPAPLQAHRAAGLPLAPAPRRHRRQADHGRRREGAAVPQTGRRGLIWFTYGSRRPQRRRSVSKPGEYQRKRPGTLLDSEPLSCDPTVAFLKLDRPVQANILAERGSRPL